MSRVPAIRFRPVRNLFLSGVGGQLAQCAPHFSQAVAHKGKGLGTLGLGLGLGLLKGGYKVLANRPGHRARHTPQATTSDVWCGLSQQCPQGSKAGDVLAAGLAACEWLLQLKKWAVDTARCKLV